MENKEILSYLANKFNLSSGTLNERMISQKAIYILQEMGLDTNYAFRWYLYGVYSNELANDFFIMGDNKLKDIELSEPQKIIIDKFGNFSKDNLNDPSFFELVSSIIYLLRNNPSINKEEIFEKIIRLKSHLNDKKQFDIIYSKLIKLL